MMMLVVFIGLMAAMAIPAFQKVRDASQPRMCVNNQRQLASALDQYTLKHGEGPETWAAVVGEGKLIPSMPVCPAGGTYNATSEDGGYDVTCTVPTHDPANPRPARSDSNIAAESSHARPCPTARALALGERRTTGCSVMSHTMSRMALS